MPWCKYRDRRHGNAILKDLTEQKFGRLIVVRKTGRDKWGSCEWLCQCSCGQEKIISGRHLCNERTSSCGCFGKEIHTKHGHNSGGKESLTYNSWRSMVQRCTNPRSKGYSNYGGRGITVCKRWLKFKNFLKDMGNRPENKTIDRINNDDEYCKENCRWATRKQQSMNKTNSLLITHNKKTQNLMEWAKELDISYNTLKSRLKRYGWSTEKTLTTPAR